MKSNTSFKVFFLKQYRKNSLKTIVFPMRKCFYGYYSHLTTGPSYYPKYTLCIAATSKPNSSSVLSKADAWFEDGDKEDKDECMGMKMRTNPTLSIFTRPQPVEEGALEQRLQD